jgi:peptide deformylase
MILPILAFGDAVLRKKASNIDADYPHLKTLIENMWETMYEASGVGLAAPQIGKAINLFIIDTGAFDEKKQSNSIKKVFINPSIEEEWGDKWDFEEGCLSIPHIRENVSRHSHLKITYQDELFNTLTETYSGLEARVIQHEYDHCQGVLFTDHLSQLKKRLLKNKLINISKGGAIVDYKMRIPTMR